jgi:hypothetical protein
LLFTLAFIFQAFIDKGVQKTGLSNYPEWTDIVESKINADLIIQGSSKAWVHVSPFTLDSALKLNSYNLGMDAYFFRMQYFRFQLYAKYNKKPRYIIQCLDCNTLSRNTDLYMFEQFIPYLNESIIRQAVSDKDVFDNRDFYIPVYKYLHSLSSKGIILEGLKANLGIRRPGNGKYKGFQPQDRKWDASFSEFKRNNANGYKDYIDTTTRSLFENFLDYCKKEDIKIFFVFTPEYIEAQKLLLNRDSIMNIFRSYAHRYDIPVLDYSCDSMCLDTVNFYNSQHLNTIGVTKFNTRLVFDLKQFVKN